MTTQRIPLNQIRVDGGTQARAQLEGDVVKEYAAAYEGGTELPPVVLFSDGTYLWLADGFHRYGGAKLANREFIEAEVREGTQRDAILYAVGSNGTHGLRRTNADKMQAVQLLLADKEWAAWSDRVIADACKVSHTFVSGVRASVGNVANRGRKRTGRNGRHYKATKPKKPKARTLAQ